MKKVLMAVIVTLAFYGAAFAGSAMDALNANVTLSHESVSFAIPKTADGGAPSSLTKLQADTGVQGSTPYEVLENLFKKGKPAAEADLTGWHAGRAVYSASPNRFLGSLIVGRVIPIDPNGGPLFQGVTLTQFRMSTMVNELQPDYYDHLSNDLIPTIESQLSSYCPIAFPAASAINCGSGIVLEYRKANGYVVEHWALGNRESYAYFFIDALSALLIGD